MKLRRDKPSPSDRDYKTRFFEIIYIIIYFNEGIRLCEKEMILFELFLREIQEYLIEE